MITCVFYSTFLIFLHFSLLYFVFIYSFPFFYLGCLLGRKNFSVFFSDSDRTPKKAQAYKPMCITRYPYCLYIVVRYGKRARKDILNSSRRQKYQNNFHYFWLQVLAKAFRSCTYFLFITQNRQDEWQRGKFECFTSKNTRWFSYNFVIWCAIMIFVMDPTVPPTAAQRGRYSDSAEGYDRGMRIFSSPKRPFRFYDSTSFLLNGNRGFFYQG